MNKGKDVLEEFLKMPKRIQELWFEWLYDDVFKGECDAGSFAITYGFNTEGCQSPIEEIFTVAFDIFLFMEGNKDDFYEGMFINNQQEIVVGKKKYYADFVINHDFSVEEKSKPLVIECDGHDFHEKTKEQVIHDNERDLDLKKAGYDVIHFSGSQIYRNPAKCVRDAIEYFKSITTIMEGAGYPHG